MLKLKAVHCFSHSAAWWCDILKYLLTIGLILWFINKGAEELGYNWQWYRLPRYFGNFSSKGFFPGPLLQGLFVTLKITAVSLVLSFFIGLATALLRLSSSIVGKGLALLYLELIRNTPLLIQIFCMYFILGPILDLSPFSSAVWALSLFEGAYASEIFRAGILSIDAGQWDAAFSLGLNKKQAYIYVILSQAIKNILPPLTSQAISLIKDSALVSTIAIYDLTMQGQAIIAETYLTFEVWFTIAAIYLILNLIISFLAAGFNQKVNK